MRLYSNNKAYNEYQFEKESEFEREVVTNSKLFFGPNSILIDAKKKIETKALGNSIPDGFLFDLSDKGNPEFYIVEVELSKHDFYNHIFPQITKFFGFFKNQKSQADLVEKIFSIINNEPELKKEFKKFLGEKEIYKFLKDTIANSQNILLIIDGEKKELPEIMETYADTWGKKVRLILLRKFVQNSETIYTMNPEFEDIEYVNVDENTNTEQDVEYNEDYHLGGTSETVINIYSRIKNELLILFPSLVFNPQKFYISIKSTKNVAFFKFSRKVIRLVILNPEDETREAIKKHSIKSLSLGVQKFYNGPSCAIIIENTANIEEVIELLKKVISNSSRESNKGEL